MKIAIYLEETPASGGAFYQSINNTNQALEELASFNEVLIICSNLESKKYLKLHLNESYDVSIEVFTIRKLRLLYLEATRLLAKSLCILSSVREFLLKNSFESFFFRRNIDLIIFMSPSPKSLYLSKIPIVTTVWDLAHRERSEFQEAGGLGEWFVREEIFKGVLPRSLCVITNSMYLKQELVRIYGLYDHKIKILPLCPQVTAPPPASCAPDTPHSTTSPYIIYPAKFWPHKNHTYILDALALIRDLDNINISAIFVGDKTGTEKHLAHIHYRITCLRLENQVSFQNDLNWVQLQQLYRQSLALVMPTYFGPTNIPVLEAFQLRVPVIYSDLPGFKEEYGLACSYVDLSDPHSLRNAILSIYNEPSRSLPGIQAGHEFLAESYQASIGVYSKIIKEYSHIQSPSSQSQ